MDLGAFFSGISGAIVGSGLATGIIVALFTALIEADRKRREKAALIAEFFVEWIKQNPDKDKLNRLSFELCLWMPAKIVKAFAATTTLQDKAASFKQLIADARSYLLNKKDPILEGDVIHFE